MPSTATAQELETIYKKHWQGKKIRSTEWDELGIALAQHPNISPDFLRELIVLFPRAAAENPALPLILMEQPSFFTGIPGPTLHQWLRDGDTPRLLIQSLLMHPDRAVATAARLHIKIAGEAGPEWLFRVQAHFRGLAYKKKQEWYLAELALQNHLPLWIRAQLAGSRDGKIRAIALNCPELRPLRDLLIRASGIPDVSRQGAAAFLPVSSAELSWLAQGPYWFRVLAARHPATPAANLIRLLDDPDSFLRLRVLRNPSTPPEVLRRYATSTIEPERIAVARNPACPENSLEQLESEPSERLHTVLEHREAACQRGSARKIKKERRLPLTQTAPRRPMASPFHAPYLSQEQLDTLANNSDRNIRRIAMRRGGKAKPGWPPGPAWRPHPSTLKLPQVVELMNYQDYTELRKAAQSDTWEIRLVMLANPLLTHDLIEELAQDGNQWIRAAARVRLNTRQPLDLFGMVELP